MFDGIKGNLLYAVNYWRFKCKLAYRITKRNLRKDKVRSRPRVIQFPITFHCNCDCVMCGMQNMKNSLQMTTDEMKIALSDDFFSEVVTVSINGGEPFLRNDIVECVHIIIGSLKKLKQIVFITNGYFTERILKYMDEIMRICLEKKIMVFVSISMDAIGVLEDVHRGCNGAFSHARETIMALKQKQSIYGYKLSLICTLTKINIYNVNEVDLWARKNGLDISYNIATFNKRIDNSDKFDTFSVLNDDLARMMAKEFFYWKYNETKDEKYFMLFLYLDRGKRYGKCPHQTNQWITLLPDGKMSFCATYSDVIGDVLECSAEAIVSENMIYNSDLINTFCSGCSHYSGLLDKDGLAILGHEIMRNSFLRRAAL